MLVRVSRKPIFFGMPSTVVLSERNPCAGLANPSLHRTRKSGAPVSATLGVMDRYGEYSMAVEDLNTLRQQPPEVFEDLSIPEDWDDDWIIIPVEEPEAGLRDQVEPAITEPNIEDLVVGIPSPDSGNKIWNWETNTDLPDFGASETFPGGPFQKRDSEFFPPPDAFAFYVPFHFFYPKWWGVYLILEPTLQLANFIQLNAQGRLVVPRVLL